ncbi:MAG: S24/S26 family peptidase [Candidatus Dormibacteria bacterium]
MIRWGAIVFLGTILLGFGSWWLTGGRWDIMTTASMSPGLPVGTLVLTRPLTGQPRVGEIVAFTPPGQAVTFMHQIVSGNGVDGFHTKGYLDSAEDAWTITRANVHAVAVAWFPGLGWALLGLPIWVFLAGAWGLLRMAVTREQSRWLGVLALASAVAIPVLIWHCLIAGQVVTAVATKGLVHMYIVSTGILPAAVSIQGHYLGLLLAGHAKAFSALVPRPGGPVLVDLQATLSWWGWAILALIVASPLIRAGWLIWEEWKAEPTPNSLAGPGTARGL